jgi:hypothetical protein
MTKPAAPTAAHAAHGTNHATPTVAPITSVDHATISASDTHDHNTAASPATFVEASVTAFEAACRGFNVGDKISATWADRPGCSDFDERPVTWIGTIATTWSEPDRNMTVRWDKRNCKRIVGAALAVFPPWDLPSTEARFAVPTRIPQLDSQRQAA